MSMGSSWNCCWPETAPGSGRCWPDICGASATSSPRRRREGTRTKRRQRRGDAGAGEGVVGLTLGVILAGGLARRMGGGDKAMRVVGGRTVLDRLLERLAPQVGRVVVNANGDPARFAPLPV